MLSSSFTSLFADNLSATNKRIFESFFWALITLSTSATSSFLTSLPLTGEIVLPTRANSSLK